MTAKREMAKDVGNGGKNARREETQLAIDCGLGT